MMLYQMQKKNIIPKFKKIIDSTNAEWKKKGFGELGYIKEINRDSATDISSSTTKMIQLLIVGFDAWKFTKNKAGDAEKIKVWKEALFGSNGLLRKLDDCVTKIPNIIDKDYDGDWDNGDYFIDIEVDILKYEK